MTESKTQTNLYHERQRLQLCAKHALNNLLQKEHFSKLDLDTICLQLDPISFINPHKSIFGLGFYDVNVLITALKTVHLDLMWFDKRKSFDNVCIRNIFGFILNIPSNLTFSFITLPIVRPHWVAVKLIDSVFYYFDSKLKSPIEIGNEDNLKSFMRTRLQNEQVNVFLVVDENRSPAELWQI